MRAFVGPGTATLTLHAPPDGSAPYVVVDQADPVIWVSKALVDRVRAESDEINGDPCTGGIELDCDVIRFGTEGYGLGRLTYRLVELSRDEAHEGGGYYVAERVEP